MKFNLGNQQARTRRYTGALLGTSALLALAGCGGGSGGGFNNGNGTGDNSTLTSANLTALTNDNRLLTFNSRTPAVSTTINVTGLTSGDALRAIDYRFASGVAGNGQTGLYGVAQNGTSQQIYRLAVSGTTATATRVGTRFNFTPTTPAATALGFDFNPTVDRIRLVESAGNRNLRLNPNADANTSPLVDFDLTTPGVQPDGALNYASGDAGAGQNPDAVGAAYTNVDANAATATTLYVLDSTRNTLATQGRADDPATVGTDESVSPNSGTLFTVGNLGIDLTENIGFDIAPTSNAAFLSNGSRIYEVAVAPGTSRGATTGGASIIALGNSRIIGLAVSQ